MIVAKESFKYNIFKDNEIIEVIKSGYEIIPVEEFFRTTGGVRDWIITVAVYYDDIGEGVWNSATKLLIDIKNIIYHVLEKINYKKAIVETVEPYTLSLYLIIKEEEIEKFYREFRKCREQFGR